jgi:hypothetical protein
MGTQFCPECRQPLGDTVYGVRLPLFKAKLFRYIETHPGQSSEELSWVFEKGSNAIRSHIYQTNELMMNTDLKIVGGKRWGYVIKKKADHV